jgi:hypothetical protein
VSGILHSSLPFEFTRIEGNWAKISPKEYQRARDSTNANSASGSPAEAFVEQMKVGASSRMKARNFSFPAKPLMFAPS